MDPMPEIGDIGLENAVGTGPFEMTEWIPGEKIVLSRFEDYAPPGFPATGLGGDRIPYLDEVIIIPMPEETARVAALEAGDVDFAEQLPLTAYRQLVSNPAINPYKVSPYIVPQLYLNLARAPFDDKAMRLAVIEAIDTEELMSAGTRGFDEFYELNCGCIWFQEAQPTLWSGLGCDLGMYDRPANTQKAQDMALAAGYNGEPIRILGYTSYYYNYAMALVLANQLGMAGFNTELEILDSPGYRARRAGLDNWDIAISGASVRFDPNFNYSYFYDLKGWNYFKEGEAEWPEMRALVEQDKTALTQADRDQIWDAMTELFIREATMVNVGELSALEAAGSNVHYEQWYQWSFWNVWFEN
jgi:peptide/nickel transport system substrate-binding protein